MSRMMVIEIPIVDLRLDMASTIRKVRRGQVVILSRYGEKVAGIVPISDLRAIRALRKLSSETFKKILSKVDDEELGSMASLVSWLQDNEDED